jgi:hypothetical protein
MSVGRPTNLVRDGGNEAKDEPPDRAPPGPFVPAPVAASSLGHDLLRADDVDMQPSPDLGSYSQVAMDTNALYNSPLTAGLVQLGDFPFATPLQRKLRKRARRERWSQRWHRLFGGSQSSDQKP